MWDGILDNWKGEDAPVHAAERIPTIRVESLSTKTFPSDRTPAAIRGT